MTKKNQKTTEKSAEQQTPQAVGLFLELEYMLFPGRSLAFDAYRDVLKKRSVTLDEMAFTRYCLKRNIAMNLKGLLAAHGKKGSDDKSEAEIAAEISGKINEAIAKPDVKPVGDLYEFLRKADEQNIKIGLLSFLPEETAKQLMERLKFKNAPTLFAMKKESKDLPTPDAWLSLLKLADVNARGSFAFVNSATAHRSALAVGMRSIVMPDKFTAWQDFSGADLVLENIAELKLEDLTAILSPAHYRK